jgi:hypothetical protein
MAFDPAPSTWLGAGYSADSSGHTISMNTDDASSNKLLAQLTDALADETTGDIRNVTMAVCEAFYQAWKAIDSADRPTKMTITRTATSPSGPNPTVTFKYNFSFTIQPTTFNVDSE